MSTDTSNNVTHQQFIDALDQSLFISDLDVGPISSPPASSPPFMPSDSESPPSTPPPHPPPSPSLMLSVTGHSMPIFNALSQLNLNLPYTFPPNMPYPGNPFTIDFLSQPSPNHAVTQTMFRSLGDESPYKQVVSQTGLSQLKYTFFDDETHETKGCPISGDEFEEGERIVTLPCDHTFSEAAIMRWITEENATCPICRFELEAREVRVEASGEDDEEEHALPVQRRGAWPLADLVSAVQRSYDSIEEEHLQSAILNSLQS